MNDMVIKVRKSCQVRHQDRVSELGDLSGEILQTTAGGGEMRTMQVWLAEEGMRRPVRKSRREESRAGEEMKVQSTAAGLAQGGGKARVARQL